MILDMNLTFASLELPKFYATLAKGRADFVHGSRLIYPIQNEAMRFLNLLGNRFFSIVFTYLLDQKFKDTLCGTKVLLRSDYEKIARSREYFGDFDPFGDFDLIFGAAKLNLKIVEIQFIIFRGTIELKKLTVFGQVCFFFRLPCSAW